MGGGTTADNIAVNYGQLEATHALINSQIKVFNHKLDEARRIATQVGEQWTGEAHEAYVIEQQKWDKAAADLNSTLLRINQALSNTGQSINQADKRNANLFR